MIKSYVIRASFVLACAAILSREPLMAQPPVGRNLKLTNDGTTGTTLLSLAKQNASGNAIIAGTSDTAVPVYCVSAGAGTTGSATLMSVPGQSTTCQTDASGATNGDYLVASTSNGGRLHDAGASIPSGVFIVGRASSTAVGNADVTYTILGFLAGPGGSGSPGGSSTQCQYNNGGSFGGITGCTSNGTTETLLNPSTSTGAITETFTVGTGGVTANTLVITDTNTPSKIVAATGTGAYGVAMSTVAATGSVEVARYGQVACVMDNAATAGDLVIPGTSTLIDCRDSGQTSSANISIGTRIVGVLRTSALAGATAQVELTPAHFGTLVSGGSGVPAFNVTTTTTSISMSPGTVGTAAAGYAVKAATYTITFSTGSDTGTFWVGASDANLATCWHDGGITMTNWSVVGLAGLTCSLGPPPTNAYYATIVVTSGSVGTAPTQAPPITLQKIVPGTCILVPDNETVSADTSCLVQKFFGTAAPGSVSGNLPGDLYSDTTNHNIYQCNATSGTAAPACTSVSAGGWTLLNGGGSSLTSPTFNTTVQNSLSSGAVTVLYSAQIPAGKFNTANAFADLYADINTANLTGHGSVLDVILATSPTATTGTSVGFGSVAQPADNEHLSLKCQVESFGTNSQYLSCVSVGDDPANSTTLGQLVRHVAGTLTSSSAIYVNVLGTGNSATGDINGTNFSFWPRNF